MNANLTGSDKLNGGAGNDTVTLSGDYSAGLTLGAGELQSIETVNLADGHSYNLTLGGGDVAAGKTMTIDGSALSGGNSLSINGSAETTGSLDPDRRACRQRLTLTGGVGNDTFVSGGGTDVITGGGGNDTGCRFRRFLRLYHRSDFRFPETLIVGADGAVDTHNVAYAQFGDQTVQIGTATTNGTAGNDSLIGGSGTDIINFSQGGNDIVNGGDGNDTLRSPARHRLTGADATVDGRRCDGTDTLTTRRAITVWRQRAKPGSGPEYQKPSPWRNGFNYALTSIRRHCRGPDQRLTRVDGSRSLGAGNSMTFNGAAETDGNFTFGSVARGDLDILTGGVFPLRHLQHGRQPDRRRQAQWRRPATTPSTSMASYSGGLTLGASTLTGIENLNLGQRPQLQPHHQRCHGRRRGQSLHRFTEATWAPATASTFNGAAETNGTFTLVGGAG